MVFHCKIIELHTMLEDNLWLPLLITEYLDELPLAAPDCMNLIIKLLIFSVIKWMATAGLTCNLSSISIAHGREGQICKKIILLFFSS